MIPQVITIADINAAIENHAKLQRQAAILSWAITGAFIAGIAVAATEASILVWGAMAS